jgi:hypothetical protein
MGGVLRRGVTSSFATASASGVAETGFFAGGDAGTGSLALSLPLPLARLFEGSRPEARSMAGTARRCFFHCSIVRPAADGCVPYWADSCCTILPLRLERSAPSTAASGAALVSSGSHSSSAAGSPFSRYQAELRLTRRSDISSSSAPGASDPAHRSSPRWRRSSTLVRRPFIVTTST